MIWLLFICGLAICLLTLLNYYIGNRSKYWPITKGKVLHSCVLIKTNTANSSNSKHYHPMVWYEYRVSNEKYRSNKIGNFIGFGNDKNFAESLVKGFPKNLEIKVFYCPFYPGISVLLPGMKQTAAHYILLFTGLILLLGSTPVLFSDNPYWFVDKLWRIVDIVI